MFDDCSITDSVFTGTSSGIGRFDRTAESVRGLQMTMRGWIAAAAISAAGSASAAELVADMRVVTPTEIGRTVGTVEVADGSSGAVITPRLAGLPPGAHGFHIHANGDCGPAPNDQGEMAAAGAAKGHWDPGGAGAHHGPEGDGHLGDLPALTVGQDGTAAEPLVAPRLTDVSRLAGLAVMIHAGGDNYSDEPKPLGGGGARIACGVLH